MELEHLQERYMSCLRSFVEHSAPQQPNRFHDLLVRLPEVSERRLKKEIFPAGRFSRRLDRPLDFHLSLKP